MNMAAYTESTGRYGAVLRRLVVTSVWCAALVLVCLLPLSGNARIFRRWGSAGESVRAMQAAGGRVAYEADVALNGGSGRMTVLGFPQPIEAVVTDLREIFDTAGIALGGGDTMSMGIIRSAGRVLRLVIVGPLSGRGTTVFMFDQSEAEAGKSSTPPRDPIAAVPAYPDAETRFHVRDDNTRTDLAVCLSKTQPAGIADFYAERLSAAGWEQHLPMTAGMADSPGMLVFEKRNALCCIYVAPERSTGKTTVAVMHKEIGLRP